jgi:hypothetical protein
LACVLPFDHDNALLVIGINILLHENFGQSSLIKKNVGGHFNVMMNGKLRHMFI